MRLTDSRTLDDGEIGFSFVRASGPGGQNVNKVSTAVELRFDIASSKSLTDAEKARLVELAGRRVSSDGILRIDARNHRTQDANRREALGRFAELLGEALARPAERVPTQIPPSARERRRQQKKRHSGVKADRASVQDQDMDGEDP